MNENNKVYVNGGIIFQATFEEYTQILGFIEGTAKIVYQTNVPRWKHIFICEDVNGA